MAALIGDVFTDSSRFYSMIGGVGLQHTHDPHYRPRSVSRPRDRDTPPPSSSQPRYSRRGDRESAGADNPGKPPPPAAAAPSPAPTSGGGASRFPSPPYPSSPSDPSSGGACHQNETSPGYMASAASDSSDPTQAAVASSSAASSVASSVTSSSTDSSTSTAATVVPAQPSQQIPSPASDESPRWKPAPSRPMADATSPAQTQTTVHLRDLSHIQSLAQADLLSGTGPGILNDPPLQAMKYEIGGMPIGDIIEMVAALLTKITTTNDLQHDALNRNAAHIRQAQAAASSSDDGGSSSKADHSSPLSSSVLAFHGKNVPAITILSYLGRINKYCPTTYEVFLSLLVYFDRMTDRVNDLVMKDEETRRQQPRTSEPGPPPAGSDANIDADAVMRDDGSEESDETDSDLADEDDEDEDEDDGSDGNRSGHAEAPAASTRSDGPGRPNQVSGTAIPAQPSPPVNPATYFVVDSFNIHRLIIAGVTCASKFFSDVFYTNSRYAKVGGLPLPELNHLELQFLILNDFRLAVPVEDLEAYATMLVEFYAREVVAQRSRPVVERT